MPARLAHLNLSDAAFIAASSQVLLAPISNLQQEHVLRRWRSAAASAFFVADLGGLQSIDVCAVMGLTGDTIRFRYSTTDATGDAGDAWDSGVLAIDQLYLQALDLRPAPIVARYVRVDIDGGTDPFVEAGRLFVGLTETFGINFGYGWQRGWIDPSSLRKTEGGQTQIKRKTKTRVVEVAFDNLTKPERDGLVEQIDGANGLTDDILFIGDPVSPNLARDSIFGLMTDLSPVSAPVFGRYSKPYKIEGRL